MRVHVGNNWRIYKIAQYLVCHINHRICMESNTVDLKLIFAVSSADWQPFFASKTAHLVRWRRSRSDAFKDSLKQSIWGLKSSKRTAFRNGNSKFVLKLVLKRKLEIWNWFFESLNRSFRWIFYAYGTSHYYVCKWERFPSTVESRLGKFGFYK